MLVRAIVSPDGILRVSIEIVFAAPLAVAQRTEPPQIVGNGRIRRGNPIRIKVERSQSAGEQVGRIRPPGGERFQLCGVDAGIARQLAHLIRPELR